MEALGEVGRAIKALISVLRTLTPWLWWDLGAIASLGCWEGGTRESRATSCSCLPVSEFMDSARQVSPSTCWGKVRLSGQSSKAGATIRVHEGPLEL